MPAVPWTRCTVCGQPTPGADVDDQAWCQWCFDHSICPPQDVREAQRLAREVERTLAVTRLAQTLGRH